MKVLVLTKWYPREDNLSSGVFVKEFANSISLFDEVLVLYGYGKRGMSGIFKVIEKKENDRFRVIAIVYRSFPIISNLIYSFCLIRTFLRVLKDFYPDVIHVHVYSSGLLAFLVNRLYKIPYVVTEHYAIYDEFKKENKIFKKIRILLARMVMNNSSRLLQVSKFMVRDLERVGIKNRFRIVPNVVNLKIFYPPNKKIKSNNILFVGLPSYRKGIDVLIKAAYIIVKEKGIKNFTLNIVGTSPLKKKFESEVKKLELEDNVIFHGYKTKEEIAEFMRNSDFLILPSLWENFPCVLLEAKACGLPIIATDVGGVSEIVEKETGILIPPGDIDALVDSIIFMMENFRKFNFKKIAQKGEKYGSEIVGRRLHDIYEEIIRGSRISEG